MEIIRDPCCLAGYRYENPIADLPSLTHCGEVYCSSDHCVALHTHPGFEFMYVIAGTAYWQVDETVYEQHQNELFWTVPGQPHMTANREHQAYHKLWLGVRTVDLDRACLLVAGDLLTLSARKRHIIPDAREMEAVIRGLILQVIWQKPGCAQVCRSYLHTFLSLVAQSIAEGCSSSKTRDMRPFCPPVHNAIAFMRDNLHRHVKLEEIAAAAHLSASQLSFHFHRSVGMSRRRIISRCVLKRRAMRCCSLR